MVTETGVIEIVHWVIENQFTILTKGTPVQYVIGGELITLDEFAPIFAAAIESYSQIFKSLK